jgi:hypothetical protein
MPLLDNDQLRELSRQEPNWELGCKLRLEHPKEESTTISRAGDTYTLRNLFRGHLGFWFVSLEETGSIDYYAGRFSLASKARPRYKTNHKIGVPKGILP